MKLTNCILDIDRVVMRSPMRTSPHPDWKRAYEDGVIPENVHRFYCCAEYFSLDKAPNFLDDQDRLLFSFLHNILEGVRHAFEEANELLDIIREAQGKGYSQVKRIHGETWDSRADERQSRSFRYLIVIMFGALDQLSEVVSIFFHGAIPELTVKLKRSNLRLTLSTALCMNPQCLNIKIEWQNLIRERTKNNNHFKILKELK